MKVYADANIWVDFAWSFLDRRTKIKCPIQELFAVFNGGEVEVVTSALLNAEISAHYRDWLLLKRTMRNGFSYREFSRIKSRYDLSASERHRIDLVIDDINSLPYVSFFDINGISKNDLNVLERLTLEFGLDLADGFHVVISGISACNCFITKDEKMIKNVRRFLNAVSDEEYKICKPQEFISDFVAASRAAVTR